MVFEKFPLISSFSRQIYRTFCHIPPNVAASPFPRTASVAPNCLSTPITVVTSPNLSVQSVQSSPYSSSSLGSPKERCKFPAAGRPCPICYHDRHTCMPCGAPILPWLKEDMNGKMISRNISSSTESKSVTPQKVAVEQPPPPPTSLYSQPLSEDVSKAPDIATFQNVAVGQSPPLQPPLSSTGFSSVPDNATIQELAVGQSPPLQPPLSSKGFSSVPDNATLQEVAVGQPPPLPPPLSSKGFSSVPDNLQACTLPSQNSVENIEKLKLYDSLRGQLEKDAPLPKQVDNLSPLQNVPLEAKDPCKKDPCKKKKKDPCKKKKDPCAKPKKKESPCKKKDPCKKPSC